MQPRWTAEREIDLAEARALVAAVAPELAGREVAPFASGWDNTAYLVGGEFVFRFPRRALGEAAMRGEIAVLPHLAPRLPLAIPNPCFVGGAALGQALDYPWPFAGYRLVAGEVAAELDLDEATCAAATEPLAGFLRALHEVPADEARAWGAPEDELDRLGVERRLPFARKILGELAARGELEPEKVELVESALAESSAAIRGRAPRADALVHGDLDARHVLVDAGGTPGGVLGVIDWGDVHVGDPALDLALALTFLPPSARAAFDARYGLADAGTWAAARFRALVHQVSVLEWAVATGRARTAATARRGLVWAAAGA